MDMCKQAGIPCIDMDGIKKFNKQGKPVKKWARTFDIILVSDTLNKLVAAQIGKILSSVHKLPMLLAEAEKPTDKIKELTYTCRWRMKKVRLFYIVFSFEMSKQLDNRVTMNINQILLRLLIKIGPMVSPRCRNRYIKG